VALGCAVPVRTAADLDAAFARLLADEPRRLKMQDQALNYVHQQAGATARIMVALGALNAPR